MPSSVNLGTQLEALVNSLVKNGRYGSRSEVLREGIRLVQEREARLETLKAKIQQGIDDFEAGRSEDAEVVFERLRRRYESLAAKAAA